MHSKQISLLAALLAAKVDFAVVGGVAVIAHGHVHTTNHLDIFIRPTEENALAAFIALRGLGVPLEGLDHTDLLAEEEHLRFGSFEDHVDILSSIGEMPFKEVWRSRIEIEVDGFEIPFISKSDLIENKLQVGRHRDLSDVEALSMISES